MAPIRIILHGKAASDSRLRTAVSALRKDDQVVEVRVTWEPGDAARLTAEAVAEAVLGKINCIVAGGGDGTINEVFATAHVAGLPDGCSLGIVPLGTANDFAHSAGVPTSDIAAAFSPIAIAIGDSLPAFHIERHRSECHRGPVFRIRSENFSCVA